MFSRSAALEAHVSKIHQDIIGRSPTLPPFLPSWMPSFIQQMQPPTLPIRGISAEILTGECNGSWKASNGHQLQDPQPQFLLASRRKNYPKLVPRSSGHCGEGVKDTIFADLIKTSDKHGGCMGDLHANCLIQGKGIYIDLSRAQGMLPSETCIHRPLPQTIHYEVFEQRLEALEREETVRLC